MPFTMRAGGSPSRRLAPWRIVLWLILLLAALGCLQYLHHGQQVWAQMRAMPPGNAQAVSALRGMLAWDVGYLLAAFVLIVLSAGGILGQAWSRGPLRVVAVVLAAWSALSGVWLFEQWNAFVQASHDMAAGASPQSAAALRAMLDHARRSYWMGLALKAVSIPLLLWLAWQLGRPAVRAQFRARRGGGLR